jgi:hypothetical protein
VTRSERIKLGIGTIAAAILVVLFLRGVQGHTVAPIPVHDDAAFRPFPTYQPSPTPIIGLHEYAVPLRPAPTATPTPVSSARPKRGPAAGHTSSGSGTRTIPRRHRQVSGKASWHATGRSGLYAAACRPLRQAIGSTWRGRHVLVSVGRRAVEVTLNDFCASTTKTIDLSDEVFRYFAPLSRGVIKVVIGW